MVQTGTLRADDTPAGSTAPKGELLRFAVEQSKIFPGTVRDCWIYVPKQYDPASPACLYVNQHGIQYCAPDVFDQLIHTYEVNHEDIPSGKAYKIGLDGNVSLFIADTKHANGQAFGPDGRLYAAATGSAQILAYDSTKPTVIAEGIRANDLVVRHDGGIYVTQPCGGGGNSSQVWYINPQREKRVVDKGLRFANGVTLSPDQSLLYVADYASHWVYSYQAHPDLCFGGADSRTLFATCGERVYKRKLQVRGVNAYEPPIKPKAPRL